MDEKKRKAPGRFERSGVTLIELLGMFPDDAAAEAWFAQRRWPDGRAACPSCGSFDTMRAAHKSMPYHYRERGYRNKKVQAAGGPVGKAIVAGVRDRETGRIAARVVPDTKASTLTGLVADHTEPGAQVFTDEARGYLPLGRMGFDHQAVSRFTGQWVDEMSTPTAWRASGP